jgi:hypothetical protein
VLIPVSAVTGVTTIFVVGGVAAELHARVAVEGVTFRRFAAIIECEPAVSPIVRANRVVPYRLNTEKSIMDHPFCQSD